MYNLKNIFVLLYFVIFIPFADAYQYVVPRSELKNNYRQIVTSNYNNPAYMYNHQHAFNPYTKNVNTQFEDINELERYIFKRSFVKDSVIQRIERLEMQAFGAVQTGDIDFRYKNVKNAILSRPTYNYKTSFLKNLGNYLYGQSTGYTPSLTDNIFSADSNFRVNRYPSTYGQHSGVEYSSPFRSGFRINDYGVGTSSGIKIID